MISVKKLRQHNEGGKVNGKIYAIPTNKEIGESYTIMFRKDLLDKYKFDVNSIQTIEDLEPWLETIKKNEPGISPLWVSGSGSDTLSYFDKTKMSVLENGRYESLPGAPAGLVLDTKKDKVVLSSKEIDSQIYRLIATGGLESLRFLKKWQRKLKVILKQLR